MKFFKLFLFVFSVIPAQEACEHIPWNLEGAQERINTHRKGTAKIQFLMDDKVLNNTAELNFELLSHEFNLGVSMTQVGSLSKTPYFENYKH